MKPEIDTIRQASREIVRELNLLDSTQKFAGHSFSECHVLAELETLGQATASELSECLVLEKSTISRLVQRLVKQGEIKMVQDPLDGRRRLLTLSSKGRKNLRPIHAHSNAQVDSALTCLPPADREAVVTGLTRYAKALRYARQCKEFLIRPMQAPDNPAVAGVIRSVMTEYGAVGCGYSIQDPEVDAMFEAYPAPQAAFFVVERNGKVLGCGGFAPLAGGDKAVCELRKMYFDPKLRGKGLGTRLLGQILESAKQAGFSYCYLETIESMAHARILYQRHGFAKLNGPMGDTGHSACNSFMGMAI
jgi:putative acetyltransferase